MTDEEWVRFHLKGLITDYEKTVKNLTGTVAALSPKGAVETLEKEQHNYDIAAILNYYQLLIQHYAQALTESRAACVEANQRAFVWEEKYRLLLDRPMAYTTPPPSWPEEKNG